jgi:hypothetical protein
LQDERSYLKRQKQYSALLYFAWDPFGHWQDSIRGGSGIYMIRYPSSHQPVEKMFFSSFVSINLGGFQGTKQQGRLASSSRPALMFREQ